MKTVNRLSPRSAIKTHIESASEGAVIVTHGTDTVLETAECIRSTVGCRTVVITGAFRPAAFKDSDAEFNLGACSSLFCSKSPRHGRRRRAIAARDWALGRVHRTRRTSRVGRESGQRSPHGQVLQHEAGRALIAFCANVCAD